MWPPSATLPLTKRKPEIQTLIMPKMKVDRASMQPLEPEPDLMSEQKKPQPLVP